MVTRRSSTFVLAPAESRAVSARCAAAPDWRLQPQDDAIASLHGKSILPDAVS
jgi:hypothetical protein